MSSDVVTEDESVKKSPNIHLPMYFRTIFAATCSSLILCSAPALAEISLALTLDDNNLELNTTGTFSMSGSTTSAAGASIGWRTRSPSGPTDLMGANGELVFTVTSLDPVPTLIYNGNTVSQSLNGVDFLRFLGLGGMSDNFVEIPGPNTTQPTGALFQIGNGTTDAITGTFTISSSSDLGSLTISDLNQSFGYDASLGFSVDMTATAVSEPSISIDALDGMITIEFEGDLEWSNDLDQWHIFDPQPSSPYSFTPVGPRQFFRSRMP